MSERRPIASRDTKLAARVARWLVQSDISPNTISQASMVFAALAGIGFWLSGFSGGFLNVMCLAVAAIGCQFRLLCNLFDGMVAVEGGKSAPDGPFWNEGPDRVADALILVGMGLGAGHPALGWAAAAFAIGTAYVRELGSAQGLVADFRGPMAKPHRMALATATALIAMLVPSLFGWSVLVIGLWVMILGAAATILSRSLKMISALNSRSIKDSE